MPETKPLPLFRRREFIYPLMMVFLIMLLAFVAKNMLPVQNQSNQTAVSQPAAEQPTPGQVESSPSAENPAVTRQPAVSPTPGGNETMSYEDAKKIFGGNH